MVAAGVAGVVGRSSSGPATIGTAELRALPPLVVVAGPRRDTGEVEIVRPEDASGRRIETWSRLPDPDGDDGPYGVHGVRWAPDLRTIALEVSVWNGDPDTQVAAVRSDGSAIRTLSKSSWTAGYTAWSPIGATLAFTYLGGVYLYDRATQTTKRIWQTKPNVTVQGIAWAPDGKRLAVSANGIVTMTRTGKDVDALTHANDVRPQWSADGRDIFFEGWHGREGIFRVSASGGPPRRIVGGSVFSLSPDGGSLLFLGRRGQYATDVYVHDLSSHSTRRLTEGGVSWPLEWSPDGAKVLFRREVWDEARPNATWYELWVMDRDGGRQTRLPLNAPRQSVDAADW